jgi:hypothetical protein
MFANGKNFCLCVQMLNWRHFVTASHTAESRVLDTMKSSDVGVTEVCSVDGCTKLDDGPDKALVSDKERFVVHAP